MDAFGSDSLGQEFGSDSLRRDEPRPADTEPVETRLADEDEDEVYNLDYIALQRMWQNEKYAPELLPFNARVVRNICEVIEFVGEDLEDARKAGEEVDLNDPSTVLRTADLERTKYLMRDYLRIRIWKLTQWPQHYLETSNIMMLSDAERVFLKEYWHQKKRFFESRLLSVLPPSKQGLDDKVDLMDMVRRPNLEKYVYIRCNEPLNVDVPQASTQITASQASSQRRDFEKGKSFLVRYDAIRTFLVDREHAGEHSDYPKVDLI